MEDKVISKWIYTPLNYLEKPYQRNETEYDLEIIDGHATVTLSASIYDENQREVEAEVHSKLKDIFSGIQIASRKLFNLQAHPEVRRQRAEGGTTVSERFTLDAVIVADAADCVVRDPQGNIIGDTKAESFQQMIKYAELAAKFSQNDPTVRILLRSHESSISNPDNELVYLFEIWDALSKRFGNEKAALKALNITDGERRTLTRIANNEPIHQGRHRGKHSELRHATNSELGLVRTIARKMIDGYFAYLELTNNDPR